MNDYYRQLILDEMKQPQFKGELENPDVTYRETNASCGDEVTVFLKISDDGTQVTDLRWQGTGCAISQAAMSLLAAYVHDHSHIEHLMKVSEDTILELLGLETITPGREKCLKLGLKAVQQSLQSATINI